MEIHIDAENINNDEQHVDVMIDSPSHCPHCGCNYNPHILNSFYITNSSFNNVSEGYGDVFTIYFCSACDDSFLVKYTANYLGRYQYRSCGEQSEIYPYPNMKREFSSNISNISPKFVSIYNEAFNAEQKSCYEICGMGYRKALEFLIKDYAILLNESDEEIIKSMPLAQCINSYVDNKHIKVLSKASAWIGNDETHYVRKHEDYNLESLKSFINATAAFIDSDIEFYKAQALLNKKD